MPLENRLLYNCRNWHAPSWSQCKKWSSLHCYVNALS